MSRSAQRRCLQDGLKLDLNEMIRRGQLRRNGVTPVFGLRWSNDLWGDVESALLSADMSDDRFGWFQIQFSKRMPQRVHLIASPRHYGGHQWYFSCPQTGRLVSTLWRPSGATQFAGREAWGRRRVAYRSQFMDRDSRAHHAQAKLRNRICQLGGFDPDEWDFPPRPKRMRQATYDRLEARYEFQDAILDQGIAAAVDRLGKL